MSSRCGMDLRWSSWPACAAITSVGCSPGNGEFQITFLDVLQLTRHHKNIINNESSAFFDLR